MNILKKIGLLSLLSVGLYANQMPSYKTSLALEVGMINTELEIMGYKQKEKDPIYGISFRMEDKLGSTNFYGGLGIDYDMTKNKSDTTTMETDYINLYPILSYNFTKSLSVNTFLGYTYMSSKLDKGNNDTGSINKNTFVYGGGIDYAISKAVTNGITIKKYNETTYDTILATDEKIHMNSTSLTYRIGFLF